MRTILTAALALSLSVAWGQSRENPYVLKVDLAPYRLSIPRVAVTGAAAGGSSVEAPLPPNPIARSQADDLGRMQQEYEQRINDLVRNRDAWRQYAQRLESELLIGRTDQRGAARLPPPPAR